MITPPLAVLSSFAKITPVSGTVSPKSFAAWGFLGSSHNRLSFPALIGVAVVAVSDDGADSARAGKYACAAERTRS